jgi:hypothetical protein
MLPGMRHLRVCIYGGTDLDERTSGLITALAHAILDSMPAVIVTGGFLHSNKKPLATSTDVAALKGARKFSEESGIPLPDLFEAWIPEPTLDDRADVQGAVRMSAADGIRLQVMAGRTPLGRRLAMVAGVDMVVTISGRQHTEVVVEQALEIGLPVLPIPDAGGDSRDLLARHRERIAAGFAPGALQQCLATLAAGSGADEGTAVAAILELLRTARVGRCLVLVPYDEEHDALYASTIEPAVAAHMIPLRLDRLPRSDAIYTSFADAIRSSLAVIADITLLNENVMYEIGYAHGRGLAPLIYTRSAARIGELPVYFKTLNVRLTTPEMPVGRLIDDYLRSFKTSRRAVAGAEVAAR